MKSPNSMALPGCGADNDADTDTLGGLNCATDQVAKFDGTDWVCAEDNSGLVVRDGSGNFVGRYITTPQSIGPLGALISFQEDPLVAPWFNANPLAALQLTPDGFQSVNDSVVIRWTALGCSGEPYILVGGQFTFIRFFNLTIIPVIEYDACEFPTTVYVPTIPSPVEETKTIHSYLVQGGSCFDIVAGTTEPQLVLVQPIELDACPPYSLSE